MTKAELKKHCEHIVNKNIQSKRMVEEHATVLELINENEKLLNTLTGIIHVQCKMCNKTNKELACSMCKYNEYKELIKK